MSRETWTNRVNFADSSASLDSYALRLVIETSASKNDILACVVLAL